MYTKKPNLFRWEILLPGENLIIINKNKVWNYDKDLEQVTIQEINDDSMTSSAFFLSEDVDMLQQEYNIYDFVCSKEKLLKSKMCFKLIPKNENAPFQRLLLGFSNDVLKELILFDQLEQETRITFNKIKVNELIKNNLFTLKIPKGVDIVGNIPEPL